MRISVLEKNYIIFVLFIFSLFTLSIDSKAEDNPGYRDVPHLTFSGVPDAEPGSCGTGIDGDVWDGTNYYLPDGTLATDVFFCDGVYTYYLQFDGTPMKSRLTYHPDGEHIIYFDKDGHEVFDNAVRVKFDMLGNPVNDICYFGTYGYMYKNEITYANIFPPNYNRDGWQSHICYFNENGVLQRNGWFEFPDGNYGYACYTGALINNRFGFDPYGRIVFYHWNGQVAKGLIADDNYYYSMSLEDGHLLGMWSKDDPSHIFMKDCTNDIYNDLFDMSVQGDNIITREVSDHSILNPNGSWYNDTDNIDFIILKTDNGCINTLDGSNDTFITNRGIQLGSTKQDVLEKYYFDNILSCDDVQITGQDNISKLGYEDSIYKEQIEKTLEQSKSYSLVGSIETDPRYKNIPEYSYLFNPKIWYFIYFYYDNNNEVVMIRYKVEYVLQSDMIEPYDEEIIK